MKIIKKYWYIIPLLLIIWYFYPQDYLKNCVNEFKERQTLYKKQFVEQYGLITCSKIKKEDLSTFNLLKGKVFSKTIVFKKYLPN